MGSQQNRVSMVVAERDSDWSRWVERFRFHTPDVVVVTQRPGEKVAAFATRVRARVAELEDQGSQVDRAVIVGGGRTDRDALAARSLAIRALASAMAHQGGGDLLLDDRGADRYSMHALAFTVAELVRGTGVTVAPAEAAFAYAKVA